MTGFRYKVFISYSHQDESWARWLQHALERYRIPKALVGKTTEFGAIGSRLGSVFRDREDLSSAASLTDTVQHELSSAETLVVICSPAAAQSHWVKEEIREFRELGRASRIYALIVDGDPQSDDPAQQCFPSTLLDSDDGAAVEPLAADIRKWADGKVLGKLKLVAGILGLRLDELRQREMLRRRRNLVSISVGVSVVLLLTTFLSLTALNNRKVADQRRANTEDLVSFMLGKLEDLSPVEGLDVLYENQGGLMTSAERLAYQNLDDEALLRQALEWREEGIQARGRRDNQVAMSVFSRSLAALVSLYLRDKTDMDSLFELGQAEFWVGYSHMDNGDIDKAEESMIRYGVVARRLINADPKNADNVMELSYTLTNLAAIETMRASGDGDRAIYLAQAALEYNQLALVLEPDNQGREIEMASSHAWLADAWLGTCSLEKARLARTEGVGIIKNILEQNAGDRELLIDLSHAQGGLSHVLSRLGLMGPAEESLRASASLLGQVVEQDSDLLGYEWDRQVRLSNLGRMMLHIGRIEEGRKLILGAASAMAELYKTGDQSSFEKKLDVAESLGYQALAAFETESMEEARRLNLEAILILLDVASKSPDFASAQYALAKALISYWQLNDRLPPPEWLAKMEDYSLGNRSVESCDLADLAMRQAVMRGDLVLAASHKDYLLGKGYREPGFIRFCRGIGLCEAGG